MPIIAVLFLIFVPLLGLAISYLSNRDNSRLMKDAMNKLNKKLSTLEKSKSLEDLVYRSSQGGEDSKRTENVAKLLAETLDFRYFIPSPSVSMVSILKIDVTCDDSAGKTLSEYLEPYAYDLVDGLMSIADHEAWESAWGGNMVPRGEDELMDFILTMTIGEFLSFFSTLSRPAE